MSGCCALRAREFNGEFLGVLHVPTISLGYLMSSVGNWSRGRPIKLRRRILSLSGIDDFQIASHFAALLLKIISGIWCLTKMTEPNQYQDAFRRGALRSAFHSLFWGVIVDRKRNSGLKMKDLADKLGVHKSFVSRSFSSPPNWRIDTLADFSDALGLDLIVEARDRKTGRIFTSSGISAHGSTTTRIQVQGQPNLENQTTATDKNQDKFVSYCL